DPDGDARAFVSVPANSANGLNNVSNDGTWIYYSPGTNGNSTDTFSYTIRDVRASYRLGDTGRTATGTVQINVTGTAYGIAQNIMVGGGSATVNFSGIPGYAYDVQRTTNLVDWVNVLHTNAPGNGQFQFIDTFSDLPSPPSQAYYRLSFTP